MEFSEHKLEAKVFINDCLTNLHDDVFKRLERAYESAAFNPNDWQPGLIARAVFCLATEDFDISGKEGIRKRFKKLKRELGYHI